MAPIMCQFPCLQPVRPIGIYCVEKHVCEPVGSVNRTSCKFAVIFTLWAILSFLVLKLLRL